MKRLVLALFLVQNILVYSQEKELHGVIKWYNSDSSVRSSKEYDHGKRVGTWINNYTTSKVIEVYSDDSLRQYIHIENNGDTIRQNRYVYTFLPNNKLLSTFIFSSHILTIKKIHNYKGMDSIIETLDSNKIFKTTYHIDSASATERVYSSVDKPASFKKGNEALGKFIADNLTYPRDAKKAGTTGTIRISFIVNLDGSISILSTFSPDNALIGSSLDKEARRVMLRTSGMWIPGKINGKPVRSYCQIPITFELE